jgi:hypothetical protein
MNTVDPKASRVIRTSQREKHGQLYQLRLSRLTSGPRLPTQEDFPYFQVSPGRLAELPSVWGVDQVARPQAAPEYSVVDVLVADERWRVLNS